MLLGNLLAKIVIEKVTVPMHFDHIFISNLLMEEKVE